MGANYELQWSYNAGSVSVTGAVSEADTMFAVSYDANGKMLGLGTITVSGGNVTPDQNADTIKLIWLDKNFAPKCGSVTINNS